MAWDTRRACVASLNEFAPWLRRKHKVVRFWSTTYNRHRYCRVLVP